MPYTIKDIANIAGVSTATVSRALNNKAEVNAETKKKILKVIEDCDFKPSTMGRGLSLKKTFLIGVVFPDFESSYFQMVFRGIEEIAGQHGYSFFYLHTNYNVDKEREALRMLRDGRVDGMIMLLSNKATDECKALVDMGYPVVLFGNDLENVDCPSVICNNFSSAYTIVEHLIQNGHTKIAHITGNRDTKTGILRLQGYQSAMENYGIKLRPEWNLETRYLKEEAYTVVKEILKAQELPTAIFAANDTMALGCYKAIYEAGLRIPDDISIAGHDDIDVASLIYPALTTMRQQTLEIGRTAARKLLDILQGNGYKKDINVLSTSLISRQSVKNLNQNQLT